MSCIFRKIIPLFIVLFVAQGAICQEAIIIGSQEWMAKNLDVDRYSDGSKIAHARTKEEWIAYNNSKIGCYCYYDNQLPYGAMYGKLYNIYAIKKGIAPHCWRMPSRYDVDKLVAHLGPQAAKKLKAANSWSNDWNGTNESRFAAFAAGCRNPNGTFSYVGRKAFWWVWGGDKQNNTAGLHLFIDADDKCDYDNSDGFGFSVRCVRDANAQPPMPCP